MPHTDAFIRVAEVTERFVASWSVLTRRIPAKADSSERFYKGDELFTFFQRRHDISEHDEA